MAAKRVTSTAVNWAEFASKIPAANKGAFAALKTKQDGYIRAVNQLPDALPSIDFASYKGRVATGNPIVKGHNYRRGESVLSSIVIGI